MEVKIYLDPYAYDFIKENKLKQSEYINWLIELYTSDRAIESYLIRKITRIKLDVEKLNANLDKTLVEDIKENIKFMKHLINKLTEFPNLKNYKLLEKTFRVTEEDKTQLNNINGFLNAKF